jgi:tetratricopeptide (TPR) repeat protein/predicted Ser/Thr protein kinase
MGTESRAACLSENTLAEFVEARLAPERVAETEDHLAGCATCLAIVGQMAAFRSGSGAQRSGAVRRRGDPAAATLRAVDPEDYRVLREIARGGMGRILEAWDRRHGRPVAIKVLLREDEDAAAWFEREARITARLQHPSIIPLYEAGRWSAGEPFFAMKLVAGRSLDRVMEEARTTQDKVALLPHFIAVTEALAYAHEQRVAHRDLKPSNVLVGDYGETVVIDWGLASELRAGDDEPTVAGHAVGTPCYMPPEQARGEPVDERADVYALGALLYQLFTGSPPYSGTSSKETIARVVAGPPEPLASRLPGLPADLATLVDKAMAREPADRYPSAKEMSADLKRYAEGQLVSAHAYSPASLLVRWVKRHRAVVSMAALLVAALAVGGGSSIRRIVRERDRADASAAEAERQRVMADTQREAARKAGDTLDAAMLARRAASVEALAAAEDRKNDTDAALSLYEAAVDLRRQQLEKAPDDDEAQFQLASDRIMRGQLEPGIRAADAMADFQAGHALAEAAHARAPEVARWSRLLGRSDAKLAQALRAAGDDEGSRDVAAQGVEVIEHALAVDPSSVELRSQLGWAAYELGEAELHREKLEAAAAAYGKSLAVRSQLHERDPGSHPATRNVSACQARLGEVALRRGDLAAALAALETARASRVEMVKAEPGSAPWQAELAETMALVAGAQQALGRTDDAIATARGARELARRLVEKEPASPAVMHALVLADERLGDALLARGRMPEAREAYDAAMAVVGPATEREPDNPLWQEPFAAGALGAATAALGAGDLAGARERARAGRASLERARAPAAWSERLLPQAALVDGDVALAAGDVPQAIARYEAAEYASEARLAREPGQVDRVAALAEALVKHAAALGRSADGSGERDRLLARALDLLDAPAVASRLTARQRALREAARRTAGHPF